tara:strand:- start:5564 stop:5716 length:153 start_codon:yes stop_codon:yes gene_type:complete
MNKTKQFKIETPLGSVESDSGNHFMDIASVVFIIAFMYAFKKIVDKYITN